MQNTLETAPMVMIGRLTGRRITHLLGRSWGWSERDVGKALGSNWHSRLKIKSRICLTRKRGS